MSLRDYFAAHATDGDISEMIHDLDWREGETDSAKRVRARFAYADEMIAARGRL